MDEQLAAIYGTNQVTETEDQEKLAAAELLVKLAEDEGVDLEQFSDEEISDLINEIYSGEAEKVAATATQPDEAQEKLAEADFLGRVMAHAYTQERAEIEKTAKQSVILGPSGKPMESPGRVEKAKEKVHEVDSKAGEKAKAVGHGIKEYHKKGISQLREAFSKNLGEGTEGWSRGKKVLHRALVGAKGAARFAPHAAAVGLGAYGLHHALKKKSEADLDKLAEDRAAQLLIEQGWMDEQGNLLFNPEQVKEAEAELTPEQAVEIRALQMLEENGFPVTWNE